MVFLTLVVAALTAGGPIQTSGSERLKAGAKVYVHSMPNGFDSFMRRAIAKKKVPIVIVEKREEAEFELKGTSESQKANAVKIIFMGSWQSDEQASISVTNVESGEIVFAYSVVKKNSAHGRQSTAEACAKHLKEALDKKK
jgi:hypothetical protein